MLRFAFGPCFMSFLFCFGFFLPSPRRGGENWLLSLEDCLACVCVCVCVCTCVCTCVCVYVCMCVCVCQSELPWQIPWNQTSNVHEGLFDNITLTSQKPCQYKNKFDCSEANGYSIPLDAINETNAFSIKYRYSDILLTKKA